MHLITPIGLTPTPRLSARTRSRILVLALGAVAAGTGGAQTKPESRAAAAPEFLPLCTPGLADPARLDAGVGLYEMGNGLLATDLADPESAQSCLKATAGNLTLNVGGVPLNLSASLNYSFLAGPQRRITTTTISPVLCESYYTGNDGYALELTNVAGDVLGTGGTLGGVTSLSYAPGVGTVTPTLAEAAYGPWLRCFDATTANAVHPTPSAEVVFGSGFEPNSDLRVEFLSMAGAPIDSTMQLIGADSVYRVRVSNLGEVAASNVRIREFIPKAAGLLTPTMNMISCVRDADAQSCAAADGRLHQNLTSLAPGAAVSYVLTRRVNGTPPISAEQGARTSVAAFVDPASTRESRLADNSRNLRVGLLLNGQPVATAQNLQTNEDSALSIVLTGSDPEGSPLTFATGAVSNGALSGTGANRTFTPNADFNGVASFTFTVSDGVVSSTPATVNITVLPLNDAPRVANPISDRTVAEGSLLDITTGTAFSDPEGHTLSFAITGLPAGVPYSPSDGRILGLLSLSSAGVYNVQVTATEVNGGGLSVMDSFQLTVTNTNQNPTLVVEIPDQSDDEGDAVVLDLSTHFADTDPGDVLTYSVVSGSLPQGLSLDSGSGIISGSISFTAAPNSPYTATVRADDGNGGQATDRFNWVVAPVNATPLIAAGLADRSGTEGVFLNIPGAEIRAGFSDPDGDTLSYSATGLPSGLIISPTDGAILGTPGSGSAGVHVVTVRATDPGTLFVEQDFELTIQAP